MTNKSIEKSVKSLQKEYEELAQRYNGGAFNPAEKMILRRLKKSLYKKVLKKYNELQNSLNQTSSFEKEEFIREQIHVAKNHIMLCLENNFAYLEI